MTTQHFYFPDLQAGSSASPGFGIQPESYGAIGDGDVAHMAADTHGWQMAIDASAETGLPVTPRGSTYIIDGYKGDHAAWAADDLSTHGGLIMTDGARILGAGRGKTILKNGADLWRSIFRIRSGTATIWDLTIDGDVDNHHPCALEGGIESPTGGSIRGEGVILEGEGHIDYFELIRLEIKNTGHYGIGLQNVGIEGGLIDSPIFSNIGGDCIDSKSYTDDTGNWKRNIYIYNVISTDGAGHNYIDKYQPGEGHDAQTVLDLSEGCYAQGCFIRNLDTSGTSTAVTGVRFRTSDPAPRNGSAGASASLIRVNSSLAPGTGSSTNDVCGVEVGFSGCHVSDVVVDGGYRGVSFNTAGSSGVIPEYGSIVDAVIKNISGNGVAPSYGFQLGSGSIAILAKNILVQNCDYGARLNCKQCDIDLRIEDSKFTQLTASDTAFDRNDVKVSFSRVNRVPSIGDIDPVSAPLAAANQVAGISPIAKIFGGEVDIIQPRRAYLNLVATADDNAWTGDDPVSGDRILGGVQVLGGDTDGFATGIKAGARVKAAGTAGSTTYWEFTTQSQTDTEIIGLQIGNKDVHAALPIQFPQFLKADLPVAAADNRGYVVYLTDAVGSKHIVVSNGSSWRYMDGTAV